MKSLYLLERCYDTGYGKCLLNKAIVYAKECGYGKMYLDSLSTNIKAIALYCKTGFIYTKKYNSSVHSDIFMVLDLEEQI